MQIYQRLYEIYLAFCERGKNKEPRRWRQTTITVCRRIIYYRPACVVRHAIVVRSYPSTRYIPNTQLPVFVGKRGIYYDVSRARVLCKISRLVVYYHVYCYYYRYYLLHRWHSNYGICHTMRCVSFFRWSRHHVSPSPSN